MSDDWLAAAFYLPLWEGRQVDLRGLARRAGVEVVPPLSPEPLHHRGVDVEWAGRGWAWSEELAEHDVLAVFFRQSYYLECLDVEPERNPLALKFRQACVALRPDVAFVVTHLHQAERAHLLSFEWPVIDREADVLLRERFGLLYLDGALAAGATTPIEGRDTLPVDGGLLVFSRSGSDRWF